MRKYLTIFNLFIGSLSLVALFLVFQIINLYLFGSSLNVNPLSLLNPYNPQILDLTPPIFSLTGTVYKVASNNIQVLVSNSSKSNSKPTIYTVAIANNTSIDISPLNITYLTRPNPQPITQVNPPATSSLTPGELVSIMTKEDLRIIKNRSVTALSITVPPIPNTVFGTIKSIDSQMLIISGVSGGVKIPVAGTLETQNQLHDYTVSLPADVEIANYDTSHSDPTTGGIKPTIYQLSELFPGMEVIVYTDVDTSKNNSFSALRIEPQTQARNP